MAITKVERKCKVCRTVFLARPADVKRGWAKCCSKSCAAVLSNKQTGKYEKKLHSQNVSPESDWHTVAMNSFEDGWDGHKDTF